MYPSFIRLPNETNVFQAIQSPLTYRSQAMIEGPWRRAMAYLCVSLALAGGFVTPLLWESRVKKVLVHNPESYGNSPEVRICKSATV